MIYLFVRTIIKNRVIGKEPPNWRGGFFFLKRFKTNTKKLYLIKKRFNVMKLELKPEFLEWSINSGGRSVKRKLKNVHPSEFEKLYNLGYKDFFNVVEGKTTTTKKEVVTQQINDEIKDINLDDTNK